MITLPEQAELKETLKRTFERKLSKTESRQVWAQAKLILGSARATEQALTPSDALAAAYRAVIGVEKDLREALSTGAKITVGNDRYEGGDHLKLTLKGDPDSMGVSVDENDADYWIVNRSKPSSRGGGVLGARKHFAGR